jgi:hypothetical protein
MKDHGGGIETEKRGRATRDRMRTMRRGAMMVVGMVSALCERDVKGGRIARGESEFALFLCSLHS